MRKKIAPWWVGLALILATPCIVIAQALYFNLEIFWPLGNALWLLGVWGLIKFSNVKEVHTPLVSSELG